MEPVSKRAWHGLSSSITATSHDGPTKPTVPALFSFEEHNSLASPLSESVQHEYPWGSVFKCMSVQVKDISVPAKATKAYTVPGETGLFIDGIGRHCCGFDVSRNNTHTPSGGWIFNGHIKSPEKQNTKINITVRSQQLKYHNYNTLYNTTYTVDIKYPSFIHHAYILNTSITYLTHP